MPPPKVPSRHNFLYNRIAFDLNHVHRHKEKHSKIKQYIPRFDKMYLSNNNHSNMYNTKVYYVRCVLMPVLNALDRISNFAYLTVQR